MTTLINDIRIAPEQLTLTNMRNFLGDGSLFSDQLHKNIQQTLSLLNARISDLKDQVAAIDERMRQGVRAKIEQKRFREVESYRKHQQAEMEPLNQRITELNSVIKEINAGLQANEKCVQEQTEKEHTEKLERKQEKYSQEVGIFNGYKTPNELTEAIHTLHKYCQGRTLEQAVQTIIDLPDRHQRLVKLRQELEAENATANLYNLPEFSKELADMAKYAQSRTESLLGYSPRDFRLMYNVVQGHLVLPREKGRECMSNRQQRQKRLQAQQNAEAKKQLQAEGLL